MTFFFEISSTCLHTHKKNKNKKRKKRKSKKKKDMTWVSRTTCFLVKTMNFYFG